LSYEYSISSPASKSIDEKQKAKENVLSLRQRLIDIGYNQGEVDYLVKKFGNGKGLTELDGSELNELKKALQVQLDIAKKCIEAV